ncbi:putative transcriptional regulator, XRE family [Sterolibacterium denitrificans]|uniref:Transcriptional regulator, XRE family n=1 Tax=Sterolibacterium denitrificans TaxID=157592 RepID=A0A7Z7HS54_9PROT|nr:helix-turn-helix transcriptional regulator [Sterolibacterium denitrificans]SMB28761.1 putative transcriptional regulator, XRE family [Sterolibacterium denitrificans]
MAKSKKIDMGNLAELRRAHGENQEVFWRRFGVTQSGGSRYESGRNIPTPIAILVGLWATGQINDEALLQARKVINRPLVIKTVEYFT